MQTMHQMGERVVASANDSANNSANNSASQWPAGQLGDWMSACVFGASSAYMLALVARSYRSLMLGCSGIEDAS